MEEFSMENSRKVYFNGKMVAERDAKVSIYDSALMFGDMVFEMTRSFNKTQFKLEEHVDRLMLGMKILHIDIGMTRHGIIEACEETIEANKSVFKDDDEHRLMIDVSRGLLGIYQEVDGLDKGPNLIIADFPLRWTVAGMGKLFDTGINAVITSQRAIPSRLMDPKIKNRSRLFYLTANIEASQVAGNDNWALLLDEDGYVAEGTGDNFFIVKDGVVYTPEGRNILRGISRQYVMEELCESLSIPCIEKNIEPYDVYAADEAFMTGTPFCMLPVSSLNGLKIGDGCVGPVFQMIIERWGKNVDVDIVQQIKFWDSERKGVNHGVSPYAFSKK